MHQHKIVAQILLALSIFNLVLAAPVVRETYEDVVVPVVVKNVEVIPKERRGSESDLHTPSSSTSSAPQPDGPTPSHSLQPPPDEPTASHSSPPLPVESTPLYPSSPSDGAASLHEWPTHQVSGPAPPAVSLPPAEPEIVPATDEPVPVHSTSTPQDYTAKTHDVVVTESPSPEGVARIKKMRMWRDVALVVSAVTVVSGLLYEFRVRNDWPPPNQPT